MTPIPVVGIELHFNDVRASVESAYRLETLVNRLRRHGYRTSRRPPPIGPRVGQDPFSARLAPCCHGKAHDHHARRRPRRF